ncbi:hypothetical protein TVAG_311760 [Trichomonas vaginalis G3]|uniref:Uncharacterized protein n=1 Tax=Trichomonas vaginalis (strain ATCC PRA-98 / G3) TaxID=412133 RepID=A2EJY3_TRIV3|nr:hypothetical protein TVAGG3_0324830 [Trichomonas vaginalis G3]EAY07051.1 hypothetical protein TVAG_311760 [Trichomonas vaginalis G3]KAI5529553.1 hypothetical protein TVAGG3_0324830 [Trichomonas vaginalis G3]|eukprot:XP_001319274.1 hypothetical protein [Trichomonas vaginalis G3]
MSASDGNKNDIPPEDLLKRISERNIRHPFPFYYLLHSDQIPCDEIFDEKINFQSEDFLLKIPALQFLIKGQIPKLNQDKSREEWLKIFPQDKLNPQFSNPDSNIGLLSYDEFFSLHCLLYSHNYQICFIFMKDDKIYCQSLGCLSTNNVIFINCFHRKINSKEQKDFHIDIYSIKYKLISRFPTSKEIIDFPPFQECKFHVLNYLHYMCGKVIETQYKSNAPFGYIYLQDCAYFKHFFKSHSLFAKDSENILEKFGGAFKNFGVKKDNREVFQNFAKPFEQELDSSSYEKATKYTKYDINEVISDKILAKSEKIYVYKVKNPGNVDDTKLTINKNDIVKDGYLPLSMEPDFVSADNMYSLYTISKGGDISYVVGPAFPDDEFTNTFYSTKEIEGNNLINEDIIKKFDKYQPEIYYDESDYYYDDFEEEQYNDYNEEEQDNNEEEQDNNEEEQDNNEEEQDDNDQPDHNDSEEQEKSKQPDIKITFEVRHSCIAKFKYTHTFYNTVDMPPQLNYPSNVLLQIEEYCKFAHNAIKCHSDPRQKVRLFGYCNGESEFLDSIDEKYQTNFSKVTSLGIFSEFKDDILNICVIEPNIDIKYLQESVKSVKHIDSTVILSHGQPQNTTQGEEEFNDFETIAKILAIYVTLVQFRDFDFMTIIDLTGLRYIENKSPALKIDNTSQKRDDKLSGNKDKPSGNKGKSSGNKSHSSGHKSHSSGNKSHSSGHKSHSSGSKGKSSKRN